MGDEFGLGVVLSFPRCFAVRIVPRFCLERRRYGVSPASHHYHLYQTALIAASRAGQVDIVKALVDHLPSSIEVMDDYGLTALMWAVLDGTPRHLKIAKILIDVGADPTRLMNHGHTPLIDSVKNEAMKNILVQSPLIAEYDRIKAHGRDIAVCFRGGLRSYHEVKHAIKESWFDPFKDNGDRLHIIGIQAFGDKKFEETRDANTFLPIDFDTLHLQPKRDPKTFLDKSITFSKF